MKKPRSDSRLKNLPAEKQQSIIEALKAGTVAEVRDQLRRDGIRTTASSLSEFWHWWHLREQHRQNERDVQQMVDLLRQEQPDLSEERLFDYGQQLFSLLSIKSQDPKVWQKVQKLNLDRQRMSLDRDRFELLKHKAEQAEAAEREIGNDRLTPEEKEQRIRAIFGLS